MVKRWMNLLRSLFITINGAGREKMIDAIKPLPAPLKQALRRAVVGWFGRHARDFPWRRHPSPYHVWLCEMMAQQTQLQTLLPYYNRFLSRFSTVEELAAASLDDVLALWSGLGYYRRARHVHETARLITTHYGGVFPDTVEELQTLPGIGPYTAGAVVSLGYNKPAPILDGNVARLFSRLFGIADDLSRSATRRKFRGLSAELTPRRNPRPFNEGLMELGAVVCVPGVPHCSRCPLSRFCIALKDDRTAELPYRSAKRPVKELNLLGAAIVRSDGRVLLRQNPPDELLGGLWSIPQLNLGKEANFAEKRRILRRFLKNLGCPVDIAREPLGTVRHVLTHRILVIEVFSGRPTSTSFPPPWHWLDPADQTPPLALSAFTRKILRLIT